MPAHPEPEALARALAEKFGPGLRVDGLQRVSGGASRETWLFDAQTPSGTTHRLVLRRDPGATLGGNERATEYSLLAAAHASGVPVPRVRHLLVAHDGLGDGFIMDRIDGETIARKILRDEEYAMARPRLAAQCGEIAARIHRVERDDLPSTLPVTTPEQQLDTWQAALDSFGEPHCAFELGFKKLRQWSKQLDSPDTADPQLVHGDFRNGNFIVGAEGIRAVLDWELSHLGDPIEDLGWLCVGSWRFGVTDRIVGGFGDIDDLLDGYERAGGTRPTHAALRFWVALGTLKWGVICLQQAFTHLTGVVRSVELAAIGRRVAETEYDLLRILEGGW